MQAVAGFAVVVGIVAFTGWVTNAGDASSAVTAEKAGADGKYETVATLADGGSGDVIFEPFSAEESRQDVPLTLPADARQGGRYSYVLRFHYRIGIDPTSGPGEIHLVGAINKGASALQVFYITPTAAGLKVKTTELGLITGFRTRTSHDLVYESTFRNYALIAAIRPGPGEFTFKVKQFGKARIRQVRVYADTAVERTTESPASLSLKAYAPRLAYRVGDQFNVTYRVVNNGGLATSAGTVRIVLHDSNRLKVIGPITRRLPPVSGHGQRGGTFRLSGRRVGVGAFDLNVSTPTASAVDDFGIRIRAR